MKILYDHQAFSMQDFGGVSKIFFELANHLRHYPDVHTQYPRMFSNNDYVYNDSVIGAWSFLKNTRLKGKGTVLGYLKRANKFYSRQAIQKGDFDIFHPTYYNPYYLEYQIKKPTVVTCYDLIHEKYMKEDHVTLEWKKRTLNHASKIIAISENTKNDLIEYYKIPDDRIDVVHLGSSFEPEDIEKQSAYDGPPFFLFVGNRSGYKNFLFLVEAITPLLQSHENLNLYCAGGAPFSKEELQFFNRLKIASKIRGFDGSKKSLEKLYSQAKALIYPSLYEGFGIPLLEAMSCKCPVVSSNMSSLPEVAGDAAIYFDPQNEESIFQAAKLILEDEHLRKALIAKGTQRLTNFSWEKAAKKTLDTYKSIL